LLSIQEGLTGCLLQGIDELIELIKAMRRINGFRE